MGVRQATLPLQQADAAEQQRHAAAGQRPCTISVLPKALVADVVAACVPVQMQFVRDSDAVSAILAGAGCRPAEELVTALRKVSNLSSAAAQVTTRVH